jgi:thiosulfate dehydrogenase [quinone] large subunit
MIPQEARQSADRLIAKYGMRIPKDVALSVFSGQPKVPVLLSRASFRSDVDARTEQRTQFQHERRQLLQNILGVVGVSVVGLLLLKTLSTPPPPPPAVSNPFSNPQPPPVNYVSSASTSGAQLLVNASNIPLNQVLPFDDPTLGSAILIHLSSGQFVAYSTICTHAGCQVQYDPSVKELVCPCHGAVYDPSNNAQVLAGPAPYPLQSIPIHYDTSTGNIFLAG